VIIVYDDLSNQAISYRQLCLLMKRAPSRDAYPGDVFYLHARLLERAGNFAHGGSITAIPIAQLQENDLSSYIPTNLISITDGQTIFDNKLFNKGRKPAINTELSVSRVGGAAQRDNIKKISKSLKLELAQYQELELFSQFTGDLDKHTIDILNKGKLLVNLLNQDIQTVYTTAEIYIILYLYKNYHQSLIMIKDMPLFIAWLLNLITHKFILLIKKLESGETLSPEEEKKINIFIEDSFIFYETM
jgi:F-type H+-transporting ATPase subunit alpha